MKTSQFTISIPCSSANIGPGFDCVGIGLTLRNEFSFNFDVKEYSVKAAGEIANDILDPEKNLVVKCYRDTLKANGIEPEPFKLESNNNIPLEGGLGSSATAILAGVVAARKRHGFSMDRLEILKDALIEENHPDNLSACLYGGYTVAYIKEDGAPMVFQTPISSDLTCWVIHPYAHTNTKQSRLAVSPSVPLDKVVLSIGRVSVTTAALIQGRYEYLFDSMIDYIHEPGRMPPHLRLPELKAKLQCPDFYGWAISGSGPSILTFCRKATDEMREKVKGHFKQCSQEYNEYILQADNRGLLIHEP